ncbi:MAG: IS30 family transposase [Betaproteobacteria bacterium]|nr:IS30 family transposase [Betaproteobacteria bacterium]
MERDTMYVVLSKVSRRTTEQVCGAIVRSLKALGAPTHTLTLDNGSEFCGHERITEQLGMRCYFARPYAAWQRGLNENHNGLVRRYIPKKSSLAQYTQADLDEIAHQLNHRPRKTLGYRTPTELLMRHSPRKKSALRN